MSMSRCNIMFSMIPSLSFLHSLSLSCTYAHTCARTHTHRVSLTVSKLSVETKNKSFVSNLVPERKSSEASTCIFISPLTFLSLTVSYFSLVVCYSSIHHASSWGSPASSWRDAHVTGLLGRQIIQHLTMLQAASVMVR